MCFISQKAYRAIKASEQRLREELETCCSKYNELIDRYDKLIVENSSLKETVKNLKEQLHELTPKRDNKGRFVKRD